MQTRQCRMTYKGLLTYLGLEVIVLPILLSELKWVRFISRFMVLYFRNVDLDLPKIFALFWMPVLSRYGKIILCICDQQVSFGQIMFSPPPPPPTKFCPYADVHNNSAPINIMKSSRFWEPQVLACAASVPVRMNFSAFWPRENINWGESKKSADGGGSGETPVRRLFALAPIFARPECGSLSGRNKESGGNRA